ncbi:MAG TPA: hypothetical protein GX708_01095 [Gallicola sp.]|nr:hypothetical protein [Gallicola sp.]
MLENKITFEEIKSKLDIGETLEGCGIETLPYLPIAQKRLICENIVENCIEEIDGMKFADPIKKDIAINISLIRFYTNIDADLDDLCEYGIMDYIINKISKEYWYICDIVEQLIENELNVHNSLVGMLNRKITELIERIPKEDAIKQIVDNLPEMINRCNPESLSFISQAIGWNNGIQPNRQQKRKAAKENKATE